MEDPDCSAYFDESSYFFPPEDKVNTCPLVSFPGSGSKWVLHMMEIATGYATDLGVQCL